LRPCCDFTGGIQFRGDKQPALIPERAAQTMTEFTLAILSRCRMVLGQRAERGSGASGPPINLSLTPLAKTAGITSASPEPIASAKKKGNKVEARQVDSA